AIGAKFAYIAVSAARSHSRRAVSFSGRRHSPRKPARGERVGKWDWQVFLHDTGGGQTYLQWMMSAWGWTMSVAVLSLIVALLVGSLMGILRTTPNKWLVFIGNAWTELFRNIPLLVQIFLWYHVIPSIFLSLRAVPSFVLVVFGLGFFTSARIAEQVKAGILALSKGQRYAGLAM